MAISDDDLDLIEANAREAGGQDPQIVLDLIDELRRSRSEMTFQIHIPTDVDAVDAEEVKDHLAQLTARIDQAKAEGDAEAKGFALLPRLMGWCDANGARLTIAPPSATDEWLELAHSDAWSVKVNASGDAFTVQGPTLPDAITAACGHIDRARP